MVEAATLGARKVRVASRDLGATKQPSPEATRMGQATSSAAVSSSVSLLGIPGLRVIGVFEFVDERHVFVESVRDFAGCDRCGRPARHPGP